MFDFLSSDPAPARRDFSKSIEKDFSGCADFESRALSAGGVSPCAPAECLGTAWRSTNGNVMAVDDDGEGDVAGGEDERSAVRTHRGRMRGESSYKKVLMEQLLRMKL